MNKILKLFDSCIISKGVSRSIILDHQRNNYYLIPNSLASLFEKNVLNLSEININENHEILDEYIKFLIDNELCFYCDVDLVENFTKVDINEWDYPALISNAIIEIDYENFNDVYKILEELTNFCLTRYIELNILNAVDLDSLKGIIAAMNSLDLFGYNIIFSLVDNTDINKIIGLIPLNPKIQRCIIHNAPVNDTITFENNIGNVFLLKDKFSYLSCGTISMQYFSNNIDHISESQNHNTCLNRKLFIGRNGDIKNCPNTVDVLGNITLEPLREIISKKNFKSLWFIKKDEIAICKDCEFRHICTDCRAFIEDPDNLYSKPLKCGYDPFTNEWQDWSKNPIKEKAIDFYKLR